MSAADRLRFIHEIEDARDSRVLTYFLSDRKGANGQIAEDAVRPMYEHLRRMGEVEKLDLFLYSVGGLTEVPWRIVSMIREHAEEFCVLVPYKAMSAATMVAIGADEIVMGPKGELGPIDPRLNVQRGGEGETLVQETIAVEDVMAYLRFIKDKVGLSDQTALTGPVETLADRLSPWGLGQINRAHSHIRSVARKLLLSGSEDGAADEQRIEVIVETLAEKTYQHGHAIGREEAEDIGLNAVGLEGELDRQAVWPLFKQYEELCQLQDGVDPRTFVPEGQEEYGERVVIGCIESSELSHHFTGELRVRKKRDVPQQLQINTPLNLQLPPGIDPDQLPDQAQQILQQLLQAAQQQVQQQVQQQIQEQMPVVDYQGWTQDAGWGEQTDWPPELGEEGPEGDDG